MPDSDSEPIEYIVDHVKSAIRDPGGTKRVLEIQTRLLTPTSVIFVSHAFLHVSTSIVIDIPLASRESVRVRGTIKDCKHKEGREHVCVVELDEPLRTKQFTESPIQNSEIELKVLYIEDLDADRLLLQHKAKGSNLGISTADTIESASDKLRKSEYDVVVCDYHLEKTSALDVLKKIRPELYTGPFVIMTAETRDTELARMLEAGADAVLTKPVTMRRLSSAIHAVLSVSADQETDFFDPFDAPPEDMGLALSYIPMLAQFRDDFIRAKQSLELEPSLRACRSVMGSASGYGFQRLGGTAERAYAAIHAAQSIQLAGSPVTDFIEHMKAIIDSANNVGQAEAA